MSPRRTRSGKVLSPEAEAPGSVKLLGHLGLDPGLGLGLELSMLLVIVPPVVLVPPSISTTRTMKARAGRTEQNNEVGDGAGNIEVAATAATEAGVEEEIVNIGPIGEAYVNIGTIDETNLNIRPDEDINHDDSTPLQVTDVEDGDAIKIVSETVKDSVIDLTDDTSVVTSPLRIGGHWATTPSFLARIPPNPWFTPRLAQSPIMVDLTDSPANSQALDNIDETPTQDLDTTTSPGGGGGISVQCPVCLESLKSIKRSGANMVSTGCGHIFCSRCLPARLRASGRCPSCRRKIGAAEYHKIFI